MENSKIGCPITLGEYNIIVNTEKEVYLLLGTLHDRLNEKGREFILEFIREYIESEDTEATYNDLFKYRIVKDSTGKSCKVITAQHDVLEDTYAELVLPDLSEFTVTPKLDHIKIVKNEIWESIDDEEKIDTLITIKQLIDANDELSFGDYCIPVVELHSGRNFLKIEFRKRLEDELKMTLVTCTVVNLKRDLQGVRPLLPNFGRRL